MRTLQLLEGNPCQRSCSTNPSWERSIPPPNWRNQRCSRMVRLWFQLGRNPGLGNPCHEHGSTTPSFQPTIRPPSSRSRQRSCMGPRELAPL